MTAVRGARRPALRRWHMRRPVLTLAVVVGVALAAAPSALAHAQLLGSSPASGATVAPQPQEVIFEFNQNVGGTLGAVRVYNAAGEEVDDLAVSHPQGNEHWMGVGLRPALPDGTYTATYRVVSADTHIVYGGLVFNIGHAGAAPKFTVAGLIGRNESGRITRLAFGAVRVLDYLAIALALGGLAFMLLAWLPGFEAAAGAGGEWRAAARAFDGRMRWLLCIAVVVGALVSVLGILLQGASAAGVSLWASLKSTIVENTLEARFGQTWGARAIDWILLGALLAFAARMRRRAEGQATATAPGARHGAVKLARTPWWLLAPIGLAALYLAITPALSGHASVQNPTAVFFPADVLHVLAASVWVGGIACLLLAVPAATGRLEGPDRSRVLLATLTRFSPLALVSVIVIALSGVVQAYIDVRTVHGLLHSTYGALVIAKTVLLLLLIGLGWVNRERVIPALGRIAGAGAPPGQTGVLARRTMRGELALMIAVFGVTAALITYAPPIDAAAGPFSANTSLGPAELEITIEPAKVGLNTAHLYLIDARTGAQFTATKELTATARLPSKGIGPLVLHRRWRGPATTSSAQWCSARGDWEIQIVDRVSEFESFSRTVKVPIG